MYNNSRSYDISGLGSFKRRRVDNDDADRDPNKSRVPPSHRRESRDDDYRRDYDDRDRYSRGPGPQSRGRAPPPPRQEQKELVLREVPPEVKELFAKMAMATLTTGDEKAQKRSKEAVLMGVSRAIQDALRDSSPSNIENLHNKLADLGFEDLWSNLVKGSSLWTTWFPQLLCTSDSDGIPEHIREDARIIVKAWAKGDMDSFFMKGLKTSKPGVWSSKSVDKDSPLYRPCNVLGHNGLENGQWFPLQVCLMRDGAHGEIEAGIYGSKLHGVLSIIVAGGSDPGSTSATYEDDDFGDELFYVGTRAKPGATKPTHGTQYLLDAVKDYEKGKEHPVRVFRSSKCPGKYAPAEGIRYDGLYVIKEAKLKDKETLHYRVHMARLPGQGPIRWEGLGKSPNEVQLGKWKNDTKERGLASKSTKYLAAKNAAR